MRFRHPDGSTVHLAYCANVHPAETLHELGGALRRYARPVRERLGVARLGVGLWLAAPVAADLAADPGAVAGFRDELTRNGVEVVTLNGFPYRGFSDRVVKGAVYRPDWTEPERATYTLDLARVLAGLLPDDVAEGTISTLPLAWRAPWDDVRAKLALDALAGVADDLDRLAADTGRIIRLGLEPEPGCVTETVAGTAELLAGLAPEWVGVCVDACHLAVAFEAPATVTQRLAEAGVRVVKSQLANALRAAEPARAERVRRLRPYEEPRFLHQVRERTRGPLVQDSRYRPPVGTDDLGPALDGGLPGVGEWRVHFHVPVHTSGGTTQDVLLEWMEVAVGGEHPLTTHLEVETYTWPVMPGGNRLVLVDGLVAEMGWARDRLLGFGLGLVEQP